MDEIPEPLKKILLINAILAFILAIIYMDPLEIIHLGGYKMETKSHQ